MLNVHNISNQPHIDTVQKIAGTNISGLFRHTVAHIHLTSPMLYQTVYRLFIIPFYESQKMCKVISPPIGNHSKSYTTTNTLAKGENAIVDYLGFNGTKPAPTGKWISYTPYQPVIIEAPAEVADERGAITADYQTYLEQAWIKDMRSRHKIKINKKVLKMAR